MTDSDVQEGVAKEGKDFIERIERIETVLTVQSRDTLIQIYQELVSEVIECMLRGLGDVFGRFAEEVPYLSADQCSALKKDICEAFRTLRISPQQTISGMQGELNALYGRIAQGDFSFAKSEIPQDVFDPEVIERIVQEVIRECFGDFIRNLPFSESVKMPRAIERAIAAELRAEGIPTISS